MVGLKHFPQVIEYLRGEEVCPCVNDAANEGGGLLNIVEDLGSKVKKDMTHKHAHLGHCLFLLLISSSGLPHVYPGSLQCSHS